MCASLGILVKLALVGVAARRVGLGFAGVVVSGLVVVDVVEGVRDVTTGGRCCFCCVGGVKEGVSDKKRLLHFSLNQANPIFLVAL